MELISLLEISCAELSKIRRKGSGLLLDARQKETTLKFKQLPRSISTSVDLKFGPDAEVNGKALEKVKLEEDGLDSDSKKVKFR